MALKATNPAERWDTLSMANQKGHAIRALLCFVWEAPVNCTCFFWFFRCLDPCDSFRMVGLVSEHPKNCKSPRHLLPKSLMIAPRAKTRRHAKENTWTYTFGTEWLNGWKTRQIEPKVIPLAWSHRQVWSISSNSQGISISEVPQLLKCT